MILPTNVTDSAKKKHIWKFIGWANAILVFTISLPMELCYRDSRYSSRIQIMLLQFFLLIHNDSHLGMVGISPCFFSVLFVNTNFLATSATIVWNVFCLYYLEACWFYRNGSVYFRTIDNPERKVFWCMPLVIHTLSHSTFHFHHPQTETAIYAVGNLFFCKKTFMLYKWCWCFLLTKARTSAAALKAALAVM